MKLLFSALVLFLTCRFNSQFWACRSCFCCRSWVWLMSFFSCFLSLMRVQVLADSHSLCCPLFFPRTSLHVAFQVRFQVSLRPRHVSSTDGFWLVGEYAEPVSQLTLVDLSLCFFFQAACTSPPFSSDGGVIDLVHSPFIWWCPCGLVDLLVLEHGASND